MLNSEDIFLVIIADEQENPKGHWQSLWERGYPLSTHVTCSNKQSASEWIKKIDQTIRNTNTPVIIAAHGVGVLGFLQWLFHASLIDQKLIYGALLVAPTNPQSQDLGTDIKTEISQAYANFPTALISSDNDPYCDLQHAKDLANSLGAKFYTLEKAGHINAESGFGPWQWGMRLMQDIVLKHK